MRSSPSLGAFASPEATTSGTVNWQAEAAWGRATPEQVRYFRAQLSLYVQLAQGGEVCRGAKTEVQLEDGPEAVLQDLQDDPVRSFRLDELFLDAGGHRLGPL